MPPRAGTWKRWGGKLLPLYMAEDSEQARALAEQPSALSHLISKCCEELVLSQVLKTKFTCGLDNSQAAKSIIIQLC